MPSKKELADFRENYQLGSLERSDLDNNPIRQFQHWLDQAIEADLKEPNVMTLATVNQMGHPSARILLLKGLSEDGFVFYSNYESRKGQELKQNPFAAMVFCWLELERQVRIEGKVERLSAEESLSYFHRRPKGSQIGAWASPQSQIIPNRTILSENVATYTAQFENASEIPLPPHWGGYRLRPTSIEFWQGRTSRLHDRFLYQLAEDNKWHIERLAP